MSAMVAPALNSIPSSPLSRSGTARQRRPVPRSSEVPTPSNPMTRVSGVSMRHASALNRTVVADRVLAFLRARHPQKMAECVAAETGINVHTIRKLEERSSAPSITTFMLLGAAYGPEFLHAVSGWDWLNENVRARRIADLEARRALLDQELRALAPAD